MLSLPFYLQPFTSRKYKILPLVFGGPLGGSGIPTPLVPFYPLFLRLSYVLPCERVHSPSSLPGRDFQGAGWMFICLFVCRKK